MVIGSDTYVIAGFRRACRRRPGGGERPEIVAVWNCEIGVQIAVRCTRWPIRWWIPKGTLHLQRFAAGRRRGLGIQDRPELQHRPFRSDIMNATGLAFGANDLLYVSSRNDGIVYR